MNHVSQITRNLDIKQVINVDILQRIQDTFAKAMCCAAMMVDKSGNPVTRASNFVLMCEMIRSTEAGFKRCMGCDAEGGHHARNVNEPHIYVCKGGLTDIAAPVTIEGEYLGSVHFGQIIPSASRLDSIEEIIRLNSNLGFPKDDVRRAAEQVPTMARERIAAAAEMLFLMANYIVEMGVANLTQAKLFEETQSKLELKMALQSSQLQMLESQINPHFLFNALGLIGYTAIQEHASQTEEITYCLSDLLRYSLRNVTRPVTLSKELEIIQRYLSIQKLRFGLRLNTQIEVDPWLYQARIPCMILQPLVENAVVHAVERMRRPVTVQLRALPVSSGMLLEVIDDGPGMEAERVTAINTRTFAGSSEHVPIGLQNVIRRLELEYGSNFTFEVESEPGRGTRIAITLPIIKASTTPAFQGVNSAWLIDR